MSRSSLMNFPRSPTSSTLCLMSYNLVAWPPLVVRAVRDAVFLLGVVPPLIIDTVGEKWRTCNR